MQRQGAVKTVPVINGRVANLRPFVERIFRLSARLMSDEEAKLYPAEMKGSRYTFLKNPKKT